MHTAKNWHQLWEYRANAYADKKASFIDGFDSGRGEITKTGLKFLMSQIKKNIVLVKTDKILEVGCGAGMVLESIKGFDVAGCDYSKAMIREAKRRIPEGNFYVSQANKLPFRNEKFDKIISWSVFQYFPSLIYSQKALLEMVRCLQKPGVIFIGDVPDIEKKDQALEMARSHSHKKEDFDKNKALKHLYYPYSFFKDFSHKNGLRCSKINLKIPGYLNSKLRYCILMKK